MGTLLCFIGWTWVHFYWEGPYGVLIWQDATYELAERWGIDWDEFVGTGADDGLVQKWLARIAWMYAACTVAALIAGRESFVRSRLAATVMIGGAGLLVILSYAKYVAAQRQLPMFIEYGGQMLMPVVFVLALTVGVRHRVTVATAMIAMMMTFAGHGAYALNLWPTPATFHAMISITTGAEYETTQTILLIAGILDIVVCVGIFVPWTRRASALYAAVWGLMTAIARPLAGMSWGLNYWGADQFLHETILRAPHFLIPLYLFLLWQPNEKELP